MAKTTDKATAAHDARGEILNIPEWEDETYRQAEGWQGTDLVHHPNAPVRIHEYRVEYGPGNDINGIEKGGAGTTLSGSVEFTARAESHKNICHGGSMCSVMDDVVGWVAFCVTGKVIPWSGYTVQVNTKLQAPVPIHSFVSLVAVVDRVERRKVYVTATLSSETTIHATCEGLVILNRGVLPNGNDGTTPKPY